VIFAALNMDDNMQDLWAFAQIQQPQLIHHWKKFKRWVKESHLHGDVDYDNALQQFHEASQADNKDPIAFYAQISKLAVAIKKNFDMTNFFP
jgi:hypothetical protein